MTGGAVFRAEYRPVQDDTPVEQSDYERVIGVESGRLFAIGFAILRDPAEAEDAVQETAAAAWQGGATRTEPGRTRA
jgi:DNA-directed RNA polymerase specialized sigma24 family protein